jgi:hypothetical protein
MLYSTEVKSLSFILANYPVVDNLYRQKEEKIMRAAGTTSRAGMS